MTTSALDSLATQPDQDVTRLREYMAARAAGAERPREREARTRLLARYRADRLDHQPVGLVTLRAAQSLVV